MVACDKWVALKIVEFLVCIACLVTKRVTDDDESRLGLLLQKYSREWGLLNSVTWNTIGSSFADAIYGGYTIITFGLLIARIVQEIPTARRILERIFLGFGMLFFLVLGGLELAAIDSVPKKLVVNAAVLGSLSLIVAALFLIDLMAPGVNTTTHHSQTEHMASPKSEKKVTIAPTAERVGNGHILNEKPMTKPERPRDLDLEKSKEKDKTTIKKDASPILQETKNGYLKYDDVDFGTGNLEKSKFGSLRSGIEGGNYVKLDPLAEPYRLHYEQELAKFNEKYLRDYLELIDPARLAVKEDYLPEPQTPVFSKVKSGRLKSLYDDVSPSYEEKRRSKSPTKVKTVSSPTLQQLEDYLRSSNRTKRGDTPALFPMEPIEEKDKEVHEIDGRASGTPSDRGYVQYAADKWPDKRDLRTPRHSPT